MTSVADLSEEEGAQCVYVLFIDGLKYAFVTPGGEDILGTDWIGLSEHPHTLVPGLYMPNWHVGVDPGTGMPRTNNATFRIHEDPDNPTRLVELFATEGQTRWTLWEHISPTDSPLTSVLTSNGTEDLSGKAIGLETLSPEGYRHYYRCIPSVTVVGFQHSVCYENHELLPGVTITDNPEQFAGRMAALYRIYKDHHLSNGDFNDWPSWPLQYAGGGLCWIGRLQDSGTCSPDKVWSLSCYGWDSLLKKQLNKATTSKWHPVVAPLELDDGTVSGTPENRIAIRLICNAPGVTKKDFDSKIFNDGETLTSDQTPSQLAAEIDALIQEAYAGTSCNYLGADDEATNYDDFEGEITAGHIAVRKQDNVMTPRAGTMYLSLHEKVWKHLGYVPDVQPYIDPANYYDERQIAFRTLAAGEDYLGLLTGNVPCDGYVEGTFATIMRGVPPDPAGPIGLWDGEGAKRYYLPMYTGGTTVLHKAGAQEIALIGATSTEAFIEPQLCWPAKNVLVDGGAVGYSTVRYFLFRGKVRREGEEETRDEYQVARCLLREGNYHGTIHESATTFHAVCWLERWMDPMAWGLDYEPLSGDWAGSNDEDEGQIWAKPLALLGCTPNNMADFAHLVWLRIMLSTGTSTGWDDYWDNAIPVLDRGSNTHGITLPGALWGDDLEIADLGLGIPHELIANPITIADAFSAATGSWMSALCRGKWIADGPVQSWDVLQSITQPLRLMWSFHGGTYGLIPFRSPTQGEVEVVLTEDDLAVREGPTTNLRETEPIDEIELDYRYNLETEGTSEHLRGSARDPEAQGRPGDLSISLKAPGLLCPDWFRGRGDGKTITQITGALAWETEWRNLWEIETATLMAKRHFSVTNLRVARVKGQTLQPGTRVRLTNPWAVLSTGSYGITALPGIVLEVAADTENEIYTCTVLVFADAVSGMRHYAPIGRVKRIDESGANDVLYFYDDWLGHEDAGLNDIEFFAEPAWSSLGGSTIGRLYHYNRNAWEAGQTFTVGSVDTTANTITCMGALSSSYEERDKETIAVLETYDSQTAAWAQAFFGVVVLPNHKHGAVPTQGWPYH